MLTCKEASLLISEDHDRRLRAHERLGLRLHLWMCGNCRRFDRQLRLIRRLVQSRADAETTRDQSACLSDEARTRIRQVMSEQEKRAE